MNTHPTQPSNESDRQPRQRHVPSPVGHWTRTLGALAPLVISEMVEDRTKQLRFIRIFSVALAAVSEITYAYQIQHERQERERER